MANFLGQENTPLRVLNEKAFKVFQYIATMAKEHEGYYKFDSGNGYIPLSVEILQTEDTDTLFTISKVAVAHYGEQNGDLMADPDMVFLWFHSKINDEDDFAMPASYQNDWMSFYQESLRYNDQLQVTGVRTRIQEEHVDFCDMWFSNIVDQQKIPCEMPQEI